MSLLSKLMEQLLAFLYNILNMDAAIEKMKLAKETLM